MNSCFRFGDSELHKCEVMLKDIHDSVRIGTHLQTDPSYGIQDLVSYCTEELDFKVA